MFASFACHLQRRCSSSHLARRIISQHRTRRCFTSESISSSIFAESDGKTSADGDNIPEPAHTQKSAPLALIFDTETSGFYDNDKSELDPSQPALMQLGMILVDTASWETKLQTSMLIQDEVSFVTESAFEAHGITVQDCQRYGVPQVVACQLFRHLLTRADCLVAHNLDFDERVMKTAMLRSSLTVPRMDDNELQRVCTMKDYTETFNITDGNGRYKWPSLQKAFKHFTDGEMDGAHDAMVDAEACLIVFRNLVERGEAKLRERATEKDDRIARELLLEKRSSDEPKSSPAPPVPTARSSYTNVADVVTARTGELNIILDSQTEADGDGGFRIFGNTYKYRQQIRDLGGCVWSPAARAWVFQDRSRLAAAQHLVNGAPLSEVAIEKKEVNDDLRKIFD